MSFRLQMRQLNARERTYRQLLLDAPDPFETSRSNVMAGPVTIASVRAFVQAQVDAMDPKWRGVFMGLIFIILVCVAGLIAFPG
jgi:hypothetical protein